MGQRTTNARRHLENLATPMKATFIFMIATAVSVAAARSPSKANSPPSSRGRALVVCNSPKMGQVGQFVGWADAL
jgi:hypothetical protein